MIYSLNLLIILITLVTGCLSLVFLWFQFRYTYWKRRGVKGPTPNFPEGNWTGVFSGKVHFSEVMLDLYRNYKREPFIGIYVLHQPVLVVNDLELIKNIMIKDFEHFTSHGSIEDPNIDIFSENLFNASGQTWKDLRIKLTPVFTSGKMKNMFNLVLEVQQNFLKYLDERMKTSNTMDLKHILEYYTTDVIGSCAFGVNCDSFNDPDSEFAKYSKSLISPTPFRKVIMMMANFSPSFFGKLGIQLQPNDIIKFYTNLVVQTSQYRERNNIVRNDLLQLLINLHNMNRSDSKDNQEKACLGLTEREIVAQSLIFFIAAYETSSTTGSNALIFLAQNPQVQDKARQEVKAALAVGPVSYETLQNLPYIDMIIEETLRIQPPVSHLFRDCTKTYNVPGSNLVIEKGTKVFIPIQGIQMDPDIYPEPEKFIPERFSKEEKLKRHKCAHMPFGDGPRQCIGLRFAMMQMRLAILGILDKYEVIATKDTIYTTDISAVTTAPVNAIVKLKPLP